MSIASQITRINNNISNAYSACSAKGATMPSTQNSANLADCISSISGGGGGGGSVTDYLKQPLISMSTGVTTEYDSDMGSDTQTLNLSMEDYNDALFNITGKHFNETFYDASTGTWTSNDGTLTLTVFKDNLNLDSRIIEDEGGYTNRYFDYQAVYALYGYFTDWSTGEGSEVLGIYLMNANWDLSSLGTCLCIGASELYEEAGGM